MMKVGLSSLYWSSYRVVYYHYFKFNSKSKSFHSKDDFVILYIMKKRIDNITLYLLFHIHL